MKNSFRYLALLAVITGPAEAGSLAVTPGSGASIGMGTDGTNQIAASVICGATSSATLYATCLNQVFVNASGQMGVTGPVTQSGTWTVQPGNTPNTTAWLVTGTGGTFPVTGTFWQTTQPISAASLPLPTGASTSANQPTAATLGSTTSGQTGTLAIGAVTSAAPTYSTTQSNALSLNTSGGLRVDGSGVTQPVSASSLPLPTGAATAANQEVTAAGTSATSAQGVQGVTGGVPMPTSTAVNVTPHACGGTITTGGTAQIAITAQTTLHGFHLYNGDTNHNDEPMAMSFTSTTPSLGADDSYALPAPASSTYNGAGSYTSPPGFGTNQAVYVIAATTGHSYSCTWW